MAQCHTRSMSRSGKAYRSVTNKMVAGVCSGLAEHFNVGVTWLRVGFVIGTIFQPPVAVIAYVIAAFAMPYPEGYKRKRRGCGRRTTTTTTTTTTDTVHEGSFDGTPFEGMSPEEVSATLDLVEAKVRAMEDRVTSKEYILKRKFEEL